MMKYPVLHIQLESGDAGYACGYRFLIEQVDGDRHFFRTRGGHLGSDAFLHLHGMKPVSQADMSFARAVLAGE